MREKKKIIIDNQEGFTKKFIDEAHPPSNAKLFITDGQELPEFVWPPHCLCGEGSVPAEVVKGYRDNCETFSDCDGLSVNYNLLFFQDLLEYYKKHDIKPMRIINLVDLTGK